MPAYNFKKEFASLVESGQKQQTIRQTSRGAKVGGTAYLYTGMRTKVCRKLGEGTIIEVLQIAITRTRTGSPYAYTISNGKRDHYAMTGLDELARADGFASRSEMVSWFENQYGLPFNGYLHKWVLLPNVEVAAALPLGSVFSRDKNES